MHTTDLVHRAPVDWPSQPTPRRKSLAPSYHELIGPVRSAILRGRRTLENAQRLDGSWLAATRGNSSLSSELVMLLAFLEREDSELAEQCANAIRADQLDDGAWSRVPNGPADASASVLAYFALKLLGDDPTDPHMARARAAIVELGGADAADESTRRWLALLGQIDYDCCTPIAPEWLLLPAACQRRLFADASNTADRRLHTALAVIWSLRPTREISVARGVRELFIESPAAWRTSASTSTHGSRAWTLASRLCERRGFVPFRRPSLELAEKLLARQAREAVASESTFSEVVWQTVALHALGYTRVSGEVAACESRLRQLVSVDDNDAARPISASTCIPDTLATLRSLLTSGIAATQPVVANGAASLVDRIGGTSSRGVELSADEIAATFELFSRLTDEQPAHDVLPPGLQMSRDRLARFLARNDNQELPFDAVGRFMPTVRQRLVAQLKSATDAIALGTALEAIANDNSPVENPATVAAVVRLRASQRANGSWASDGDVNGIALTAAAIRGLLAASVSNDDRAVAAGVNWLRIHQDELGGWGNPSQTMVVLQALVAAGESDHDATRRGIEFLLEHEASLLNDTDDSANLREVTGTLSTLSRWAVAATNATAEPASPQLRLVGEFSLVN